VINSFGQDVAIIASGNVLSQGLTTINLSGKTGNGGSLFIAAGVDFEPVTFGQVKDHTTLFSILGPSETGGGIDLPKVTINTGTKVSGADGGNVRLTAFAGSLSSGTISIGKIDTSSKSGEGGDVTIIGEGGVNVLGNITTSGASKGGEVALFAVTQMLTKPILVLDGAVLGNFDGECKSCGTTIVSVYGTINTSSTCGAGGRVGFGAGALASISKSIITSGAATCCSSGEVVVQSNNGTFMVGKDLNTGGLSIKSSSSSDDAGNGGNVSFILTRWGQIVGEMITQRARHLRPV